MFDEYCNIPLKHFIMAGIRDDGQLVRFTGPKEAATSEVLSKYIDLDGYQKWYTTGRVMPSTKPHSDVDHMVSLTLSCSSPKPFVRRKLSCAWRPRSTSHELRIWWPSTV
jgi:hypothetical protein